MHLWTAIHINVKDLWNVNLYVARVNAINQQTDRASAVAVNLDACDRNVADVF